MELGPEVRQAANRLSIAVALSAPHRRVDLEEQDVELVNFDRSIWLDHSGPRSLVAADSAPGFSRSQEIGMLSSRSAVRGVHSVWTVPIFMESP